jgi:hypothetical protein
MVEVRDSKPPTGVQGNSGARMEHARRVRTTRDGEDEGHAFGDAKASCGLAQDIADAGQWILTYRPLWSLTSPGCAHVCLVTRPDRE